MTKTKEHFMERYPLWTESKRRKYNRLIFLKYGSGFLRTLQIAAKNAGQRSVVAVRDSPNNEERTSSGESDRPVTDKEVLAPLSNLPEEIFSASSGITETQVAADNQKETVDEVGSSHENHGRGRMEAIKTVSVKGSSTKTSSDSSDGLLMGGSKTFPDGGLELGGTSRVTNRRKKRAPQRIVKRQRTYEGGSDTSEESNADVRNKFLKISLDEEMDAGKESSDWNIVGDENMASVELHPPEETKAGEEDTERNTPTLQDEGTMLVCDKAEDGLLDTSLVIETPSCEGTNSQSSLTPDGRKDDHNKHLRHSSEGGINPQDNWSSIPRRKTARKKPGFSSLRSEGNNRPHSGNHTIGADSSVSMVDKGGMENDPVKESGSHMTSETESLEALKDKVLTGESPKLKVVCSQMTYTSFQITEEEMDATRTKDVGRSLSTHVQSDNFNDAGEENNVKKKKDIRRSGMFENAAPIGDVPAEEKSDGVLSQSVHHRDFPHEEVCDLLAPPQSDEAESSDLLVGGIVKTPEVMHQSRMDDVEGQVGGSPELFTPEQKKGTFPTIVTPAQFSDVEPMSSSEESQLTASKTVTKGRRTTIWEGSLRERPSKLKPYQAPIHSSSKKKKPLNESPKVGTPLKKTATPAKQGPAVRNYRNVAIPTPVNTPLNSPKENAEPNQEKTPLPKIKEKFKEFMEKPEFSIGNLVWGRMKGFPWWPGLIVHHYAMKRREPPPLGHIVIQWFGDMKFSQLKFDQVSSFTKQFKENINMVFVKKRNLYKKALFQALKVAALQAKKSFGDEFPEFPRKDTAEEEQKIFENTFNEMMSWAEETFLPQSTQDLVPLPEHVDRPATPPPASPKRTPEEKVSAKESEKWTDCRDQRIKELKNGEISVAEFCIGCGSKNLTDQHPLFVGGLCEICRIEYLETAYMFADDGYQCYCCICAEGDELALCENKGCYRSFCITCVELMISPVEAKKIKSQDPWICYMCQPESSFGYLKIREDWPRYLHELFGKDQDVDFTPLQTWPPKPLEERKPIRVLSLFDGIGTGMFVLGELGFKVEVYIASETHPDAIKVSSVRHKGTITHVGDVRKITSKELAEWGPFDLLIGGSPCNDLSIVNPARKGIYGGTGVLFFEYVRILRLLQLTTPPDRPLFWFFENVVFMEHQDKMTISRFLECNPVLVDAKDVSPAHRARYFWGNLPGMDRPSAALVDSPLRLQDCLEPHCNRKAKFSKVRTITTRANSLKQGNVNLPVEMDGKDDTLWCTELERLFGFPDHYTDVNNLSRGDRQKLLGQCWSVPVINHLLSPLRDYYQCQ